MDKEKLKKLSLELLKNEDQLKTVRNFKKQPLPDVEAAKKRVEGVKRDKKIGLILIVIAVALFIVVRPMIKAYKAAMTAEYGFSLSPTVFSLLFWLVFLALLFFGVVYVLSSPQKEDLDAEEIYKKNKQINDDNKVLEEGLQKYHEQLVEELNKMAGTSLGDPSPRYFFQIPFEPDKTYESYRQGTEFYSQAFNSLVTGNTFIGGPALLHKRTPYRNVRFDGFYPSKKCKISEALAVLERGGYVPVYKEMEYLQEHQEEECYLCGIWDEQSMPVPDQKFFKMRELELEDCIHGLSASLTKAGQFLASGLSDYEPYIKAEGSTVVDTREQIAVKRTENYHYNDVVEIEKGSGPFRLENAKTTTILEKAYMIMDKEYKRILFIGLGNHRVPMGTIAFNCSYYEEEDWERYHGWVCGIGQYDGTVRPDKASTIQYICNYQYHRLKYFDPLMECPEGLTPGLYRFWISGWYSAVQKNQQTK